MDINHLQMPSRTTVFKVAGALLFIAVLLPFVVFIAPQTVGADHSYVVISSSMSPTFHAGDVVIVNGVSATAVSKGDVITFMKGKRAGIRHGKPDDLVTHRVVRKTRTDGGLAFKTKGDANDEADRGRVPASRLVGRVMFSIPYIGYVITFASTQMGFIMLVAIPLGLLVLGEIYDLAIAARNSRAETAEAAADANPEETDATD